MGIFKDEGAGFPEERQSGFFIDINPNGPGYRIISNISEEEKN